MSGGIFGYITSLRPEWGRDSMVEDLNTTVNEIRNTTIPMLNTYVRSSVGPFRSPQMVNMAKDFSSAMRSKRHMFEVLTDVMAKCVDNLDYITDIHGKIFTEPNIVTAAFTFKKAMVVRYVEVVKFASDYTRMLLQYAAVCETAHADRSAGVTEAFTPADINYINSRWVAFYETCVKLDLKKDEFSKRVDRAPNTVVNEVNENVLRSAKGDDVDPLELGLLPIYINPFYHISMAVAEWQANRYSQAVDELNALQLRIANLEKLANNVNDTHLQSQIRICEKKIAEKRYKIAMMNKKYGLSAESITVHPALGHMAMSVTDTAIYKADGLTGA